MKYCQLFFISALFIIISCNSAEENSETDSNTGIESDMEIKKIDTTQLIIDGDEIWVRDKPLTGELVLKLNTGDICKILEKGEKVQVRDMIDRWYKIDYQGSVGWVFGSQTNLTTGEFVYLMDFSEYLKEFIEAFNDKDVDLNHFAHETVGSSFLYNPGAYCTGGSSDHISRSLPNPIPIKNSFYKKPQGDFCEGYPGLQDGFYHYWITAEDLPVYVDDFDEEGAVITKTIEIPESYKKNVLKKVTVISEEYHFAYLYFIHIEDMWYLFCQDFCDCSA